MRAPGKSPSGVDAVFTDFFTYRLSVLTKLTDADTARLYGKRIGLNLSEARALTIIATLQPIGVQRLADYGSLDKSQASRVAKSLLAKGLVAKSDNSEDGRATAISLTPAGRRIARKAMKVAMARNAEILAPLNDAEHATLISLLDRLVAGVQVK